MYIPPLFRIDDPEVVKDFVRKHSFGILVSSTHTLLATHIPLEWELDPDGKEVLYGHISGANPQAVGLEEAPQVLCIFSGPHTYVSSGWYDHENVPTWHYQAVHIRG